MFIQAVGRKPNPGELATLTELVSSQPTIDDWTDVAQICSTQTSSFSHTDPVNVENEMAREEQLAVQSTHIARAF